MRQGKQLALLAICIIAETICGCGKDDEGSAPPQASAQPQPPAVAGETGGRMASPNDAARTTTQDHGAPTRMTQDQEIAAVTADMLKGLIPGTLAGMKRTDVSAERNRMMGIDITVVEARFEGENDASLGLTVTDVGAMSNPMRLAMAGWTMAEFNRQTDTGYEKTGTYDGYKGMEEYDNESQYGAIRVFAAERFVIEMEGSGIPMDTLKQALIQFDLKRAASLASGS